MTVVLISLIVLFLYAVLIISFIKGWSAIPDYEAENEDNRIHVTILTACKNESAHLPALLQAINHQTYRNFQCIVIDDHSTDGTWEYLNEAVTGFPQLKQLKNKGIGKKEAIKTGIEQTNSRLIITLDADCIPSPDWLSTIVTFFHKEFTDLVICPVRMTSDGSFLQDFQQFEFAALIASGAGAAGVGMPILCNGANLAFRRQAWLNNADNLHFEEPGGDDIFLLQSIKKSGGPVRFLKSKAAMVETAPKKTLWEFIRQRRRWAGKKAAYADWQLAATALIVFLASFTILFNFLLAISDPARLALTSCLFLMKWMIDLSFFMRIKDFFDLKKVDGNSLVFSLFYPLYIVFTAIFSLTGKRKSIW